MLDGSGRVGVFDGSGRVGVLDGTSVLLWRYWMGPVPLQLAIMAAVHNIDVGCSCIAIGDNRETSARVPHGPAYY